MINKTIGISQALFELTPGAEWAVRGNTYDGLEWLDKTQTKPTRAQVEAKIAELKAAEPMRLLRVERDRLIAETDWWVLPDRNPTQEQLDYRQALRDLPNTSTPVLDATSPTGINGVTWPTKPTL